MRLQLYFSESSEGGDGEWGGVRLWGGKMRFREVR